MRRARLPAHAGPQTIADNPRGLLRNLRVFFATVSWLFSREPHSPPRSRECTNGPCLSSRWGKRRRRRRRSTDNVRVGRRTKEKQKGGRGKLLCDWGLVSRLLIVLIVQVGECMGETSRHIAIGCDTCIHICDHLTIFRRVPLVAVPFCKVHSPTKLFFFAGFPLPSLRRKTTHALESRLRRLEEVPGEDVPAGSEPSPSFSPSFHLLHLPAPPTPAGR